MFRLCLLLLCVVVTSASVINSTEIRPPVVCPDGYRVGADNRTCEDIDECAENADNCNQNCRNINGGYVCSCQQGYKLDVDNQTCIDVNECLADKGGCSQRCVNTDGSFRCKCHRGYRLKSDNKACEDIDECTENTAKCNQVCHNTDGSYTCSCNVGYRLGSDAHTCTNIDECEENIDGCDQICTDNQGSFTCGCNSGYRLESDMKTCQDIDECLDNNGGCSHGCQNLVGKYICTCPDGYTLDAKEKNCVDKDECALANGGCQHTCQNTVGSFKCTCNSGFKLNSDGLTCSDKNECTDGSAMCDPKSTTCDNLIPGYECKCKDGYVSITGDSYRCRATVCPALVESQGTHVFPSTCLEDQGSVVGDLCKFSCDAGFKLPGNADTLLCLPTGGWNASIINCKRVSCPELVAPTNGHINPASCTTEGHVYQGTCHYSCQSGFQLSGVQIKTCGSNGQWDSQEEPTCTQVYPDPWITCPDNVVVTLSPGANKADVSALLQDPKSNQPASRITITPGDYLGDKIFPAGTVTLTYVATNPVGKTAQCQVAVIVEDKEAPKTSDCPLQIYETTQSTSKAVSWTPPTFTDNVGVTKVESSKNPGDTFSIGSTNVHYAATDAADNVGGCRFTVNLKKLECAIPPTPDNADLNCNLQLYYCGITCKDNNKLFKNVYFITCNRTTLQWSEIPDCVGYVSSEPEGSCPSGYVKQGGLNGAPGDNKICVKCPRGLFYEEASKTCKECAVGYTSKQEGSLQCEACPEGSSTLGEGSKDCIAQCQAGHFSQSGFDLQANLESCERCPRDTYQDQAGQTGCQKCPNGTSTISTGSTSLSACGGPPIISRYEPNPNNAKERQRTQFECYVHGLPQPTVSIKKVRPAPDGFGGPFTQEYIRDSAGNQIGIRHIITKVTEHDAGAYECKAENKFGTDQKYLSVNVELDFGVGKRRRRRRRRPRSLTSPCSA